ncbi:MAG: hypothetical protein RLZZ15_1138 [Verrucomicrobiota bacterium]|jgi:hypothetical protein
MKSSLKSLFLACGLLAGVAASGAENASQATAKPATDVKSLQAQLGAQRDAVLAARQKMIEQLATATAEQRKVILEKLQAQQKDLMETQRALYRQIQDEMRRRRDSAPRSGG